MRRVLLVGVMFLISASIVLADTKVDYDHSVDFSKYRTFAWKADKDSDDIIENSMVLSRIQDAANMHLSIRGMKEDNRNPDVYFVPHVSAKDMQSVWYTAGPAWNDYGYGAWGYGAGGWYDPIVINYVEGTIILDMVDAKTNQLVWRSISTKTGDDLIDVQKEKRVDKMISHAFKHFPRFAATER